MSGTYSTMKLFEAYPGLFVAALAVLLLLIAAPSLHRHLSAWRARRAARLDQQVRISAAAEKMVAHRGDNDSFYDYFGAYLNAADPERALPNRATLDALIHLAWLSDTIFAYNSVDWFVAHGTYDDYDTLEQGLARLGLGDMAPAVRAARRYHAVMEHYVYKRGSDPTDAENRRFEALSYAISHCYDRAGGPDRVRRVTHQLLNVELDAMLA